MPSIGLGEARVTSEAMRVRTRTLRLAALLALATIGYSAQAAIRAIIDHLPSAASTAKPRGFDAQDHFPGAALLYDEPPPAEAPTMPATYAAPAAGVTGTTLLPDLPVSAYVPGTDGTITPARPFSMARASGQDLGRALNCLATAIYYESASEPDAGQRAVAQVILNRVRHPAFPGTVCGVVYQGSEKRGCQFSFACDGALARAPSAAGWARALRTASAMLGGLTEPQVGTATHYHTYAVTPAWNRQMVMTAAIGAHFFHRWQGYWGMPGALSRRYAGGEPLPMPHPRLGALPGPVIAAGAAPAPFAITSADTIRADYAATSVPIATPAPPVDTLPQSPVLDKWKDSGKPLR